MITFFQNIWIGIINNKDEILMCITSAEFIGLVAAIVGLIRNNKTTSQNSLTNAALSTSISTDIATVIASNNALNEQLQNSVTEQSKLTEDMNALKNKMSSLESSILEIKEQIDITISKLNGILEVQSLAYSTLKDDNIRTSILSVLSMTKHSETSQMANLKEQLESLKLEVVGKVNEVKLAVDDTVNKAENVINVVDHNISKDIHKKKIVRG